LREFCKPANGYRLGSRGGAYGGVCPAELESDFVSAFETGRQLYTLGARVSQAKSQLSEKRRELERVQHSIAATAATAVSSDATKEDRAEAVVDTAQLAERAGRLKAEIRELERDTVRYEHDYEEYRASLPPTT
jgi:predicted  nucleic acid-binding Zn-ribbon protein